MPFLTQYQLTFQNNESQTVTINLSNTLSGSGTPTPIPMTCAGAQLVVVNDDEDKFSTIRGLRLEFDFIPTLTETLSTFISSTDNQWLVEMFVGATQRFSGWLVTDATREKFLPVSHKQAVHLTASDNLGLLKDIPLTKPDGTNPRGNFRLIDYVSWCLQKTGFQLPINVVYNLVPSIITAAGDHTFKDVWLWAKTFEADFNESEDCYSVLEKILKGCFLTQHNNAWWIVRVDEMNGGSYRIQNFSYDGVIGALATTSTFSKDIGKIESIKFIGKDAEVMPERPVKYVKPTYRFEFPKEIIDNSDFSRGTTWLSPIVVDLSLFIKSYATTGDFPAAGEYDIVYKATGSGLYYKWTGTGYLNITGAEVPVGFAYVLEDWTLEKIGGGSVSADAYVAKIKQYGDEKARYAVIGISGTSAQHYIKSNPVPIGRYDKMMVSVDRRLNVNRTGSGSATEFVLQVKLLGEDGSDWTVNQDGTWNPSSSQIITTNYNINTTNETEWQTISVDIRPAPVNGDIVVSLYQSTFYATVQTHYSNFQFQYIPYTNGSYQKYNAQYNKVSHNISTKNKREEQVFTADSPKKLFKGALQLKTAGGQYYLTSAWYNYIAGTTGELTVVPFGKYQAFEYWNQQNRIIRKFQGSVKGIDSATPADMPGLLHQFTLTAATEHTTNKKFMLLSYSIDLDSCQWSGIFAEVYDSVSDKLYNSDHEFKYTTGNDE